MSGASNGMETLNAGRSLRIPNTGTPTTFTYDTKGNNTVAQTGASRTTYTWDDENRLTLQNPGTGSISTFTYRPDGKRVRKTVGGSGTVSTDYLLDGENVVADYEFGALKRFYTDYPGYWGGLASQRESGATRFYGFDPSGNTAVFLNSSQVNAGNYLYTAFGIELSRPSTNNLFCFGGQFGYFRDEADRLYVRARHYKPSQGRWLSRDPIGFAGGDWNPYGFVGNGVPNGVDASGLLFQSRPHQLGKQSLCRARTKAYCDQALLAGGGNKGLNCICRVSGFICDMILARPYPGMPNPRQRAWLDCVNECMFDHFGDAHDHSWTFARDYCHKCGQESKACCSTEIRAEQRAYSDCMKPCEKYGPPYSYGGGFPVNGEFNARWQFGKMMCCDGGRFENPLPYPGMDDIAPFPTFPTPPNRIIGWPQ